MEVGCRDKLNWNGIHEMTDESEIEEYHMVIMSSNALTASRSGSLPTTEST
jgi:hypothetical protein